MSSFLDQILRETKERKAADKERYRALDDDECQLCNAYGADKRTLKLRCGYAVHEMVPEVVDLGDVDGSDFYFLRICKACRAGLLDHLRRWRDECTSRRGVPKDHDGDDLLRDGNACIPVRENGAIKWLTRDQWNRIYPDREPIVPPNTSNPLQGDDVSR